MEEFNMKSSLIPVARKNDLVIQELQDEILVYDTKSNKAHCLNETASTVWKFCDGKNTVSDINDLIKIQTGAKVPENLIWLAIDQLNERELLEEKFESRFAGQNRREILKKIGLATVVALPIVATITAPTAALAVVCSGTVTSCLGCPPTTPCDVDGDMTIGMCNLGACVGD
jgi:hypothetical protein